MRSIEQALADEVLAEVARQRWTHKQMQERAGIPSRTWGAYFVQRDRSIPMTAVEKVAHALGMSGSELMRRAETRIEEGESHEAAADRAMSNLPPEVVAEIIRIAREVRDEQDPPGAERSNPA